MHALGYIEKGYKLTFRSPKDTTPEIIKDDVAQFAHVVIFAPETKSTSSSPVRCI